MKPFIVNRHGSLVLPSNFFPEIDFSRLNTLEHFAAVVKRDFEQKAPVGPDLMQALTRAATTAAMTCCATSGRTCSG